MHGKKSSLLLSFALVLGASSLCLAQTSTPAVRDNDTTRGELQRFDNYLDTHPEVAKDLRQNPSLVNDPNFVNSHPGLKTYLRNHPGIREEIKENPQQFMNREGKLERSGGDVTRGELRSADNFFDSHPNVARELSKNPSLVDNKEYVEKHPGLDEYLEKHPEVRADIKAHPKAFMNRYKKYEGSEADERQDAKRARRHK